MGRWDESIGILKEQNKDFLKDYEVDLEMGAIHASLKQFGDAKGSYSRITQPAGPGKYVPILLYHGLSPQPRSKNMWTENFDKQLKGLKREGYTSITVRELDEMIRGIRTFPPKPILLTFDDARRDAFVLGDPILKRHGMKATMFVPTSRIYKKDPFFGDWEMIQGYAQTGRWDIQAHGHKAHDLIAIDASENKGTFLANYLWLPEKKRLENPNEFYMRLQKDYRINIEVLNRFIADANIVGYAFPFSEAGQSSNGNAVSARSVNETILRRYFRFGFIQDLNGYNWVEKKDVRTSLMRRFSVPRDWTGEQLVQHLAEKFPPNLAQVAMAKTQYWGGQYSDAEDTFLHVAAAEPRLKTGYELLSCGYILSGWPLLGIGRTFGLPFRTRSPLAF